MEVTDRAERPGKKAGGSETRVKFGAREEGQYKWIEGKWRKSAEVAGRQRSRASLRAFGKWKSWLVAKKVRTRSRLRRVGDVFVMWDQRLVRLALLQQLRAVYGIKVKGGRGQCDRRRHETAATEIKVCCGVSGQGHTHFILDKKDTWLECSLCGDDQTCLPILP